MVTTKYNPGWVKEFYDAYGMKEWERWDTRPEARVKWHIHLHYLRQAIQPADRVLEIGAGPGRFTQELANITPQIVVADISPGQLALNKEQAKTLGFSFAVERWVEADICDLCDQFDEEEFDAVVCYGGAISYVYDRAEEAIRQLMRVVTPGGYLLLEVMAIWGGIHSVLREVLTIDRSLNQRIIASGDLLESMKASTHHIHMYRAGEFRQLIERTGLEIDVLSASNAISTRWDDQLHDVSEDSDTWQHLMEMELEACREPGCLDMGTHLIAVCRKPLE
ncbi:MAG: class I SAM-dependent methyltransferase [Armatimonadota bacterium]